MFHYSILNQFTPVDDDAMDEPKVDGDVETTEESGEEGMDV